MREEMSFHYKGNIAWSSLPGITSFHNLMYITHNRMYPGVRESEETGGKCGWGTGGKEKERAQEEGREGGSDEGGSPEVRATPVCIGPVSAKSALAGARS